MAIAIFSMFFGAGNAIFPLVLGMESQGLFGWAFLGLFLTGILGPLLGLLSATLFHGHSYAFFSRLGKIPAYSLIALTLGLLGPFAVLPRCVTVAYAAFQPLFPSLPLSFFAAGFCAISLFSCWKPRFLLPILGYILSPLLIGCLLLIIYKGWATPTPLEMPSISTPSAFRLGLSTGYDTMDLIAAVYFSTGIWRMIESHTPHASNQETFKTTLKAGTIGCLLLAGIYLGLSYTAAKFASTLLTVPKEAVMTELAIATLGPTLSLVANFAIALACLTTVISLTMTITNILVKEILPNTLSYQSTLCLNLLITTCMAGMGFSTIMQIIHPLVSFCYPVIIGLTFVNIFVKLWWQKESEVMQ